VRGKRLDNRDRGDHNPGTKKLEVVDTNSKGNLGFDLS
jgi:hypothetical protein